MGIRFAMIQGKGGGFQKRLTDIRERMKAPLAGPVGVQVLGFLRAGAKEQFQKQAYITRQITKAWAKRKVQRGRRGGSWPILNKTGRLKQDWTTGTNQRIEARRVAITVTVPYAVFHQRGTRRMVARPIGITPKALKQSAAAIRAYVVGKRAATQEQAA